MIAPGPEAATREATVMSAEGVAQGAQAAMGPGSAAGTSRDPQIRRRNRRLVLVCLGICLVMAVCGFVYVRWLMTLPPGVQKEAQAYPTRGH